MENNNLAITSEVLEKMASLAAMEVEGVAAMADRAVDFKDVLHTGKLIKSAKVSERNGAISVDLYISVKPDVNVKTVAQAVQESVKEKLQNKTGRAITHVNVNIADLALSSKKN